VSPFSAKQTRPESDGKSLNANLEKLGNKEMAKFVKDDSGA